MTLLLIFCLLVMYSFIKGTFQLEPVTKTSFIIIPIYAVIMTIISMFTESNEWHLSVTVILILIGIMLGWFQTFSVRVVKTHAKDKYGNHIFKYCRGWAYLYGFGLIFVVEIATNYLLGLKVTFKSVLFELLNEVLRERFKFLPDNGWIIWLLLAVTTSVYTMILVRRYPCIKEALYWKKYKKE
ncbi:hydrophobic protein [Lactobacillus sp. Marseille-P7033]|nr:hydrophobic protein [Lactobacillus sp. Marseille-P7033]NGC77373.1 hydrophobic protein [Limosilactobacillus reuteri]